MTAEIIQFPQPRFAKGDRVVLNACIDGGVSGTVFSSDIHRITVYLDGGIIRVAQPHELSPEQSG